MGLSSICVVGNSLRLARFGRSPTFPGRLPGDAGLRHRTRPGWLRLFCSGPWWPPRRIGSSSNQAVFAPGGEQMTITTGPDIPDVYT